MPCGLRRVLPGCCEAPARRRPPASRRPPLLLRLALAALWLPFAAASREPAVREVTVACAEDVDLPCTAPRDRQVSYSISWAKLEEYGEERIEPGQGALSHVQQESVEGPEEVLYFLKIQNATGCDSGTYLCILEEHNEPRNWSGTVTLRVTGCPKEHRKENFNKYRADVILLVVLVIFYLTLIIFTCKFARHQSIFPDFSKPGMEHGFLPVTSPNKYLEPVTSLKVEPV